MSEARYYQLIDSQIQIVIDRRADKFKYDDLEIKYTRMQKIVLLNFK